MLSGVKVIGEWHGTAQHGSAQHSTPQHSIAQHNAAQHSTPQTCSTSQHCIAQHNTVQHGTTQHTIAQQNTVQHITTQHSTAQHTTAQCCVGLCHSMRGVWHVWNCICVYAGPHFKMDPLNSELFRIDLNYINDRLGNKAMQSRINSSHTLEGRQGIDPQYQIRQVHRLLLIGIEFK